ncbi:putative monooxygenase [Gordonia namibiensis NBRC 108229]|uniref:Putative monooxygenase n=1 Tax=Gordonia namibiensis NBRC 108229 TaxID=1208314 RepID=K6XD07_9ACTN|nr:NAD(P)/FAD-dependent oxidoreductase [Gordonia namibiensis]GAC02258.1 putative monooxygenase [Gordonia namibiensis NBRC 108229]
MTEIDATDAVRSAGDPEPSSPSTTESPMRDVIIIGAGLSGIDCAYRLREQNPDADYLILERRPRMGGTWDLFRYPGVRSDSDIFSLSYPFEPWRKPGALAEGEDIRKYIEHTAHKYGIAEQIRFERHVLTADWDSSTDTWTLGVEVGEGADKRTETYRCRFLLFATGYYDYDQPYTPRFAGADDFTGQIIHPQHWPEDLDYRGKRVVVIGSGATAVSLIPNIADDAAHVTMLQRSPSYIFSSKQKAYLAPALKKLLPPAAAHRAIRLRYATQTAAIVHLTHRFPKLGRKLIRANVAANLPDDYPVDVHFNPTYNPWDQRMCMVPDADLFHGITEGSIEMVTDHIDRFDETGVRLTSGRHLDADIIVTATGLQLLGFGGTRLRIDGDEVKPHDRFVFKSHLLEDVPNLAWSVGYTNASWTLRADMTARSVATLVKYMRENGYTHAYPHLGSEPMTAQPLWDLKAGYVERSPDALPKSGTHGHWKVRHNYYRDALDHRISKIDDSMVFGRI